jgi:hypothetical protein
MILDVDKIYILLRNYFVVQRVSYFASLLLRTETAPECVYVKYIPENGRYST